MKLVFEDRNLHGFVDARIYRCKKCSTEVRIPVDNYNDVQCPRCRHKVAQKDIER